MISRFILCSIALIFGCGTTLTFALPNVTHNTIPDGVKCTPTTWCDDGRTGKYLCSIVCEKGSVVIEPWLANAMTLQNNLNYQKSLCYAHFAGTHNSAISLSNGYGNSDFELTQLLNKILPHAIIQTNDQFLSLTDQLNLGIRFLELDTHYFKENLHIAHCGGVHVAEVDKLIELLDTILADLHINISLYWDTETIGCQPSLSAIPSGLQRTLESAFQEIAAWINQPSHQNEFLMFFFDDQSDLGEWGKVSLLISLINQYFGSKVVTPVDFRTRYQGNWPAIKDMIAEGKQVLFMSGADFGSNMSSTIFYKYGPELCNWNEPDVNNITPFPTCTINADGHIERPDNGSVFRPETSEIMYGPFNGGSQNSGLLNESTIPWVVRCDVNIPSPDLLTPQRVAAFVWTWAVDQPASTQQCTVFNTTDTRWYTRDCSENNLVACFNNGTWSVTSTRVPFEHAASVCSSPSSFDFPQSALSAQYLAAQTGKDNLVWINFKPGQEL